MKKFAKETRSITISYEEYLHLKKLGKNIEDDDMAQKLEFAEGLIAVAMRIGTPESNSDRPTNIHDFISFARQQQGCYLELTNEIGRFNLPKVKVIKK